MKLKNIDSMGKLPLIILFFLMLFVPGYFIEVKIILLSLSIIISFYLLYFNKNYAPSRVVFFWLLLLMIGGSFWSLYGLTMGNPGAFAFFKIYVIWPVIYCLLIIKIKNIENVNLMFRVIIFSLICISAYTIYLVLDVANLVPHLIEQDNVFESMDARVGLHAGYIQVTTRHIASLFFILPLVFSLVLVKSATPKTTRLFNYFLLALTIFICIISGRRALLLLIPVFPLVTLYIAYLCKVKNLSGIFKLLSCSYIFMVLSLLFLFLYLAYYTEFDYNSLVIRLSGALDDDGGGRLEQSSAFIKHYFQSPFIGSGFGAGISEVIRDPDYPWWYELSYHLLLYNVGTFGFLFFSGLYIYLIYKCIKIVRNFGEESYWIIAILTGSIGIILGNATNPYLSSFEFLYSIFILLIPLNIYKFENAI